MRYVAKGKEPETVLATRTATTTNLSTPASARDAFNQIDKAKVREALTAEQQGLCAFCMRRADTRSGKNGGPVMRVAHRIPIKAEPSRALDWDNLLGSCDGALPGDGTTYCCDVAQGDVPLTVDPTNRASVSKVRYERRGPKSGLFITSDDPVIASDVERTLALNAGDLPALRAKAWESFLKDFKAKYPHRYGKEAWRDYFRQWRNARSARAPIFVGVIEHKVGL